MTAMPLGRASMRERCLTCADSHTLPQWQILYCKALAGRAWPANNMFKAPYPVTRSALYIYLHECAHMHLMHIGKKPVHVQEMEAEKQAHAWMREAGIAVPREMTRRAKWYVGDKIQKAVRRGAKHIDPAAANYAGVPKFNQHETREVEGFRLTAKQLGQLDVFEFWFVQRFQKGKTRFWKLTAKLDENDYPSEFQAATIPQVVALAKAGLR